MAKLGPLTPTELAKKTETQERYIREWLLNQAAGGYCEYDPKNGKYSLSPEQALALTDETSPAFVGGGFFVIKAMGSAVPRILKAFKEGGGMLWGDHDPDLFIGTERFFRPGYATHLTAAWIPALTGTEAKLKAGGKVADVGCGHGASTVLLAQAYPRSAILGSDYHQASVDTARKHAADAGLADRARFEVASAQTFSGTGYDLVATFDCLHDMGDPVGAARHIRQALDADGTWLIVEPLAGDTLAGNLNPVSRVYYSFSTFICVPAARSQPGVPDSRDRRRVITRLLRSVPEECLRQKRSGVRHDRIPEQLIGRQPQGQHRRPAPAHSRH